MEIAPEAWTVIGALGMAVLGGLGFVGKRALNRNPNMITRLNEYIEKLEGRIDKLEKRVEELEEAEAGLVNENRRKESKLQEVNAENRRLNLENEWLRSTLSEAMQTAYKDRFKENANN